MSEENLSLITDAQLDAFDATLRSFRSVTSLYSAIVNTPFTDKLLTTTIDLGIVVLLQVDKKDHMIDRVALSDTELAKGAVSVSAKPFHDIRIPLKTKNNALARAVTSKQHQLVDDWQYLFTPALTPAEARRNQSAASIECSLVWPLTSGSGGALIFSFYQPPMYIGNDHLVFAERYAEIADKHLTRVRALK